jgi:hypothetical protein
MNYGLLVLSFGIPFFSSSAMSFTIPLPITLLSLYLSFFILLSYLYLQTNCEDFNLNGEVPVSEPINYSMKNTINIKIVRLKLNVTEKQ